jgi:hypothetical protein
VYQGFAATGNVILSGLSEIDYNTYMTAELTPGYNDNKIRFGINGTCVIKSLMILGPTPRVILRIML